MRFREHRGSLADSMATLFEFEGRAELVAHIAEINSGWPSLGLLKILVYPYHDKPDDRIDWNETHMVYADGFGPIGFTDGALPRGPEDDWRPMEQAPRDQTIIEGRLPNGSIHRMIWAWGGGWAAEWDKRRRHGFGGWVTFNDTNQPIGWRDCGGEKV